MSRKIQTQFLLSKIGKDNNKRASAPIKIIQKKIERKEINLNYSFSNEFSSMPKEEETNEEESNNLLAQSYSFNQINKYREKILNEPSIIILESKIFSKENGGKKNLSRKNKLITPKDASGLYAKLLNKNKETHEEYLKLRNIFLNEENIKNFLKDNFDRKELDKLCSLISNLNYSINTLYISNNVNPLFSLKKLFEEITFNNPNSIVFNYNEKYNKLSPIIFRLRKIKGDGNCYYRAVMFRYFEHIILSKNIILLKKIILEMNQAFNSKEIQERLYIKMDVTFKPKLPLNIMYLILSLLEKGQIKESYQLFIKCVLSCAIFDYGLILYFRYILYLYIKNNEKKLYSKTFPVKVGNFLPSKYENEKGEFEFNKFYTNYLLKMFTEAEKIIIYLTPFVLGINLDIIIFEDNEDQIVKRFSYEEENGEKKLNDNVITLLNRSSHYELVYTYDEYNKYSEFYKNCEIFDTSDDDNILLNSQESDFFLLQNNINEHKKVNRTMVFQPNKIKIGNNNNSKNKKIIIKNKVINTSNVQSNNVSKIDNGYQNNTTINGAKNIIKLNNLVNKDNNEPSLENKNSKEIEKEIKPKIIVKKENEIPFGHPEYKSDNFLSYLDEIDNMFLTNMKYVECLKCRKKETNSLQDEYEFCNVCLKKEVINILAIDYSNYLKNENIKKKNYKIGVSIKLDKYTLYLKNILDILRLYVDITDEKELYQYIKQFVCVYCLKTIVENNNSRVIFPCGCAVCNKEELEQYFTEQNINLSGNYMCICGYKYQPKDLYALAEECNKIGIDCICLLIINIFHKNILSEGCCGCGIKKKDYEIKYKVENDNVNDFCFETYLKSSKINLMHFLCKSCEKKYQNQKFLCYFCNKIHLYTGQ